MNTPAIIRNDPWLKPFEKTIIRRIEKAEEKEKELAGDKKLKDFATGHLYFGLHKTDDEWVFREWAPNAKEIFLIGELNNWQEDKNYSLSPVGNGNREINLPENTLKHGDLYRLSVHWEGGKGDRIPSYAKRVVQDEVTKIFNAQVWSPHKPYVWKHPDFSPDQSTLLIYEAHVGMATEEEKTGSFEEFRKNVLPRVAKAGYNAIQLMAIQEHPYYGSFGYHVSNLFAVSSRFGTPEELKALIDEAHGYGIAVIMDIVHSHAVKNEIEGLALFDGTPYQYFHDGHRREHIAWDSLCFDYNKNEVLHFLLSNCQFWLAEYHFDGFRFDGVTSMLYLDHGLSRDFTSYEDYYDSNQDEDAITYFVLANKLIHQFRPNAITIAEEMSGIPGLANKIRDGGLGFDYRLAMGTPDFWIKIIKELPDEQWNVSQIYHELTNRRVDEKSIAYAESHDQALVGDKTIIFRLMDKEMYFHMNKDDQNLVINRGLALHKMIRLITLATAGGGYLNFMGNEFGHPEWIDFPREGNNWSYKYARRQWSLADNNLLRYHYLSDFDKDMVSLIKQEDCYAEPFPYKLTAHEGDQVLAFKRKELLFVFNFNPTKSFADYGIPVDPGKYRIVLNSDDMKYGGLGLVDSTMVYYPVKPGILTSGYQYFLKLYIPGRTVLVLKWEQSRRVY